jgi:hypothetical protein
MIYTKRRKRNMARTLKFVFTIFLVVFLLFITGEVSSTPGYFPFVLKPTTTACKFAKDCEEITKPNMAIVVCLDGFCQEVMEME